MERITWDRVMSELKAIDSKSEHITVKAVGRSYRGREIPMVSIGKGEKKVLYVGAHHGAEGITSALLLEYIKEVSALLREGKRIGGVDRELFVNTRRVDIVPMLNPDGVEISVRGVSHDDIMYDRLKRMNGGGDDFTAWQANGRGVDLNHNYNDMFAHYKGIEHEMGLFGGARSKYSGEYPESEPECAALCHYIRSERPRNIISLHTQGEEIYCESRGYALEASMKNARLASKLTGYRISRTEGTASMGGLLDWVTRECKIPCLTLECGRGKNPLPEDDARRIYAVIRPLLMRAPVMFSTTTVKG